MKAVAIAMVGTVLLFLTTQDGRADQTTALRDNLRSGWDRDEPTLTSALLKSGHFGLIFDTPIEGQVYGQPLIYRSTVFVATEADFVYAIDIQTGKIRWQTRLGIPAPSDCYAASPLLGAHSTPVIDPSSNTIYVLARTCEGSSYGCMNRQFGAARIFQIIAAGLSGLVYGAGHPKYSLYALDTFNGHLLEGFPVEITGSAANDPNAKFDPSKLEQRPALLLLDGSVYGAFGAYCGAYPTRGFIAGINLSIRRVKLWTDEANQQIESPQAGIWGAGGLVSDGPNSILIATGDGPPPPTGDAKSQVDALGNSVVRLRVQDNGSLRATDYFAPTNAKDLWDQDWDLGAASPTILPDSFILKGDQRLLLQVSKQGELYLLDRDKLGGVGMGVDGSDAALTEAGPFGETYSRPTSWSGDGGYIYLLSEGVDPRLRAFRLELATSGTPILRLVGTSGSGFGYASGPLIVTSDGDRGGSAILWLIRRGGKKEGQEWLEAISAVPDSQGALKVIWRAAIGRAAKFAAPASDAGLIFVATNDGHLLAFGDQQRR